ncbi:hypothetical protein H6784_04280 [Candidatus Nomurabacteria bacterium]|nr:hypothetical protein [Candidatus Kaiserbacteria bacterium]MCB9814605.1 hypothetical protein [Candidatus Nomurabacteria bacterium]
MSDFECLNKIGQSALDAGMLTPEELLKKTRNLNRDIAKLNKSPATSWVVLAGLKKLRLRLETIYYMRPFRQEGMVEG